MRNFYIGIISSLAMCIPVLFNYYGSLIWCIFSGISASGIVLAFALIPYYTDYHIVGLSIALNNTFLVMGGFCAQVMFGLIVNSKVNYIIGLNLNENMDINYYYGLVFLLILNSIALCSVIFSSLNIKKQEKSDYNTI
jgi:hypothetical protein